MAAAIAAAYLVRGALDDEGPSLTEAREFRGHRVLWLGERFRGHELTRATAPDGRFSFVYGDCEAESDSGCAPPYQLENHHACERNLADPGVRPKRREPIRGATVYEFGDGRSFDRLEVYTGEIVLTVSAPSAAEARRAVRELRSINEDVGPGDPLGPPARGAEGGRLRC